MEEPERSPVSAADIEAMTTWALIRLGRHLERLLADALHPHGLTPQQYGILAQLGAHPALTQTELAKAVLVRPQSMQHHLGRLEDDGLIARPARRTRGLRNPVRLTTAGFAVLREAHEAIRHANRTETLGLDPLEHHALDAVTARLLALRALR